MRFIDYLLKENIVSQEQIICARKEKVSSPRTLTQLFQNLGFISSENLAKKISEFYRMPVVEIEDSGVDLGTSKLITYDTAKRFEVFPIKTENGTLVLAMSDPMDIFARDHIKAQAGMPISAVLSTGDNIRNAIEKFYNLREEGCELLKNLINDAHEDYVSKSGYHKDEKINLEIIEDNDSPICKTVDLILGNSTKLGASDIHLEPQEGRVNLRYRVDGHLITVMTLPSKIHNAIVARIKILGEMDIAEQRRPQDGRARLCVLGRKIDLRISTLPTFYGEKLVVRVLNQQELAQDSLENIGFDPEDLKKYQNAVSLKQGIVLITGPTGSGKTTTLYASLNQIKSTKSNITTIEDPIEYLLDGINQTQINTKIGITFTAALRSILRQDPDVILIGEIRDRETADIAFRSSLTGHLVFTTLHTNSATGAITRLYDLGLESYLISSAVQCVVAQRLIRVICSDCKEEYLPEESILNAVRFYLPEERSSLKFYRGKGCAKCANTGYRGRTAIFEILEVNDELRAAITKKASEGILYKKARLNGLKTLVESAVQKVLDGVTTLEEILGVVDVDSAKDFPYVTGEGVDEVDGKKFLVVNNQDLIRQIIAHASSDDYFLVDGNREETLTPEDIIMNDFMSPGNGSAETYRRSHRPIKKALPFLDAKNSDHPTEEDLF